MIVFLHRRRAVLRVACLTAAMALNSHPAWAQDPPANRPPAGMPRIPTVPSVVQQGIQPALSGLAYASASAAQRLDLYRPSGRASPVPVIVHVHGGGFRLGSRNMASAALVDSWLKAGWAVAAVDYRLSGEARFPAAVQDLFAAIAYLRANARELGLDPERLVVFGESAGANLAALAGTAWNDSTFRATLPDPRADIRPSRVIALYPPVDFSRIDPMLRAQGCFVAQSAHDAAESFESLYLGAPLPTVPQLVAHANPASHVSAQAPAFFIQNGDQDCNVGAGQGAILADALRRAGVPVHHELIAGAGHGGPAFETPANLAKLLDFLR